MSDPRLLDNETLRATLKRIHAHAPDAWKDADLLRDHIEALDARLAKMCDLHMDEKRRRMAAEGEMKDLERAVASYQQAERERLR